MIVIKAIDKQILRNTKFTVNPCLEFACAVGSVGKREAIFDMAREMNFVIAKDDQRLLDELEKGMSKYIRSEMEYFFKLCDIGVLVAAYVSDYEDISTVSKFLNIFDKETVEVLFKYLGGIFIASELPKLNSDWDQVKDDMSKMKAYINSAEAENIDAKEKLLECMDNPEETKQRLSFFFKQFYEKSYLKVEKIVLNEIKDAEKQYIKLIEINPEEFISKYFFNFFKIENGKWDYKINIHLSLFLNIYFWTVNLHDYKEKQGWVVVGIRTYKLFFQKETFERVDRFLKVLGDKRRVDIVKMLSYKPYYGYEIAAKLELTPATVNYHINLLMDAGILTFDREENKVYYTLNKDRVKELLNETSIMLINEPLK